MAALSTVHALAGASAGAISMAILYPLDNLRTRLQVRQHLKADNKEECINNNEENTLLYIKNLIMKKGVSELYTGLNSAIVGIVASSYLYFWWYSHLKEIILKRTQKRNLTPTANTLVAALAGAINCTFTVPFWVVNTRITLSSSSLGILETLKNIIKNEGFKGLYHGYVPSLVLVINPIIQFVCYEQFIRILGKYRNFMNQKKSAGDFFVIGAIAKAIATVLTYPLQVVKSRLQQENCKYKNAKDCVQTILKEEGVGSFFQGMFPKLAQTTLNAAFTFAIYEKLVRLILRLSYMIMLSSQSNMSA